MKYRVKWLALARAIVIAPMIAMLGGCVPTIDLFHKDNWKQSDKVWSGPTVQVLVNHINCELASAYDKNSAADPLWTNLSQFHYVAAIDLNLLVTHNEGANPSFSFITPLDAAGNVISPVIKVPKTGQTATSAQYNRTLAVGAQLSGTQSNTIDIEYVIDMNKLLSDTKLRALCLQDPGRDPIALFDGLSGSLSLDTTINDGLHAIDATGQYNIYGSSGPTNSADQGPPPSSGPGSDVIHTYGLSLSGNKPGSGGAQANSSGTTSFAANVSFIVSEGVNGGPNWTVLEFKGPSGGGGSSGGGGGGGSGGGGSGGSSGSGGGGSQLLNFTRSATDSLSVTFEASCQQNTDADFSGQVSYDGTSIIPDKKTLAQALSKYALTAANVPDSVAIPLPSVSTKPTVTPIMSNQTSYMTLSRGLQDVYGAVKWTGYVLPVRNILNISYPARFSLVGTISDLSTASNTNPTNLGIVQVQGTVDSNGKILSIDQVKITVDALIALMNPGPTANYWATVPGCDTVSTDVQQSRAIDAAAQSRFLRLLSSSF
jgi:hypothetical protein